MLRPAIAPLSVNAVTDSCPSSTSGWANIRPDRCGPGRVLVIDDSQDVADSMQMVLDLFGYETRVEYCGPSGLQAALEWRPDVILCDIGLPGLNGYEIAAQLRAMPGAAPLTLIAITGYGTADDRRQALASGFDHHLTKPVAMPDLLPLLPQPD